MPLIFAQEFDVDCKGVVTKVVDGDTVYVKSISGFGVGETFKVRFADVNAPELYTEEGQIAKTALTSLIYGKDVILDIDDLYIYDKYGRVVAVVYMIINSTHILNVNYWLVVNGYADIRNYENEFNPYEWSLYVKLATLPVPPTTSQVKVVINEVELNPPGEDRGNEWIELYNPTSDAVDIGGWSLTTTHGRTVSVTIPVGTTIPPNGYYVVSYKSQWLDDEDESVVLKDKNGNEIDRTPTLDDTFDDDRTWQRYPNGKDTDSLTDWKFKTSTKERSNGGITVTGPTILTAKGKVSISIPSVTAYRVTEIPIGKVEDIPITKLAIKLKNNVNNLQIGITKIETLPATIKVNLKGRVYCYLNIEKQNVKDEDFSEVKITFSVEKTWVNTNNIDVKTISLYRYSDNKWNKLPTNLINENQEAYYFEASSPSLSILAISGEAKTPVPAKFEVSNLKLNPTKATVGEEVIVSVAVRNVGEAAGTYTVSLWIDGVKEKTKTVSLAGGESKNVFFTIIKKTVGDHTVRIDGLEAKFKIVKAPSTITISVSSEKTEVGKELKITGRLEPPLANVEITLTYTKAGKVKVTHTVKTMGDGSFTDTIKPDAGGTWTVQASWKGTDKYEATESKEITFEAVEKRCIIATATYGSELAKEVQFLRGFRESIVYQTKTGTQFMKLFNTWYYSWSPYIASLIWKYPMLLKPAMQTILYPLLKILYLTTVVYDALNFYSELRIIVAGLIATTLISLVYITPLTLTVFLILKKYRKNLLRILQLKPLIWMWVVIFCLLLIGEILALDVLLAVTTGILVILTIILVSNIIVSRVALKE